MKVGDTHTIIATVSPSNATNKAISWESSDSSVATVSDGIIMAVGAGTAIITVKTSDGNKSATCYVSVQTTSVPVVGITISPTILTLKKGATRFISTTVYPSNATNNTVRFNSSDNNVAFVDSNGILAAVGVGTATITATTEDGGYTAYLKVTVKPKGLEITKVKAGKKKLTVQWKQQKDVTGYQVEYGMKADLSDGKKITIDKAGTVKKDIKKLKAKKKYYVRIRSYKTVKGVKYYSAWSGVKKKKAK